MARARWRRTAALVCLVTLVGCDVESARKTATSYNVAQLGLATNAYHDSLKREATKEEAPTTADGLSRKIVYTATVDLVVEDFYKIPEDVVALVKRFDAYVASSNLTGAAGDNRHGTWQVRVPIGRFDEFVAEAKRLGELVSAGTSSRDVSEEYYDVDARIRNKTKEEERLLKLLEERPGELADVIAIERELSRVREELERMQGRMRVLTDLTSMTTVTLSIGEIQNYQPAEAATLTTRIRRTFEGSLAALSTAGEETLIVLVAATPWLPLIIASLFLSYFYGKKLRRRLRGSSPAV